MKPTSIRLFSILAAIVATTILSACTAGDLDMKTQLKELTYNYVWQPTGQILYGSAASANIGAAVDMSENYAIVGESGVSSGQGAAYIYTINGGKLESPVTIGAGTPATGEMFGMFAAIDDSAAVVASPGASEVSIFERSGSNWTWVSDKTGITVQSAALDISGLYFIAGDYSTGNVYVYHKSGIWTSYSIPGSAADRFGYSAAISGDYAAIGADSYNGGSSTDSGIVYIYKKSGTNTWNQVQIIEPATRKTNGFFGWSIAIKGNKLCIGELLNSNIYFYENNGSTWEYKKSLSVSGISSSDHLGFSLSITEGLAIAGAYGKSSGAGSAYAFTNESGEWDNYKDPIEASGLEANDYYGYSVAINSSLILVGACQDNNANGSLAGAVYIFERVKSSD